MPRRALGFAILLAILAAGCSAPATPVPAKDAALSFTGLEPRAIIDTTKGRIVAQIALEEVPGVAQNFLNLSEKGYYDGTRFHRVAHGFIVQGGDPNSRGNDSARWGLGGPGYAVRDEFHAGLRHNASGVLSMASSGPDTAGSQFFFTLAAAPGLDDRNSVFGRVIEGMDVVEAIGSAPNVGNVSDGRPIDPVTITKVTIVRPTVDPALVARAAVVVPVLFDAASDGSSPAVFALVVKNNGTVRDTIHLSASAPSGWRATFDDDAPFIAAGASRLVTLTVTPPAGGASQGASVTIKGTPGADGSPALSVAFVDVKPFGGAPVRGENATVEYAGLLPDGRVFATSIADVGESRDLPFMSSVWAPRAYAPYRFTVGTGNVTGFSDLAARTRVGETSVARIAWPDAYAYGSPRDNALQHRDVVFVLRMLAAG